MPAVEKAADRMIVERCHNGPQKASTTLATRRVSVIGPSAQVVHRKQGRSTNMQMHKERREDEKQ
jgi:hypothetical protein